MSALILKAIQFGTQKHDGQVRKGTGVPYITHPIMVSYILAQYKQSKNIEDLICASILHDTLEDTEATFVEIVNEFNPLVASLVLELTNDERMISELGKLRYMKTKLIGMSNYALIIKLADRLSNISDKPTVKSVLDTIDLMGYLRKNRKLTASQSLMVTDILTKCYELKRENEK